MDAAAWESRRLGKVARPVGGGRQRGVKSLVLLASVVATGGQRRPPKSWAVAGGRDVEVDKKLGRDSPHIPHREDLLQINDAWPTKQSDDGTQGRGLLGFTAHAQGHGRSLPSEGDVEARISREGCTKMIMR